MFDYVILYRPHTNVPRTTYAEADLLCRYSSHDSSLLFKAFFKSVAIFAVVSTVAAAVFADSVHETKDLLEKSLSTGSLVATGYLTKAFVEARQKVTALKERFENSFKQASEVEKRLSKTVCKNLERFVEPYKNMIDVKRYPIKTLIAIGAPVGSIYAVDGQGLVLALGAQIFMSGCILEKETKMTNLYHEASYLRQRLRMERENLFSHFRK